METRSKRRSCIPGKSGMQSGAVMRTEIQVGKPLELPSRKAAIVCPTQVDEERILRPTEEALLRNSAKCPRNFGRRGASLRGGRREKAQATV